METSEEDEEEEDDETVPNDGESEDGEDKYEYKPETYDEGEDDPVVEAALARLASAIGDRAGLASLGAMFESLDTNGTGELDPREFKLALEKFGIDHLNEDEVMRVFAAVDTDGGGTIDFDEFAVIAKRELELAELHAHLEIGAGKSTTSFTKTAFLTLKCHPIGKETAVAATAAVKSGVRLNRTASTLFDVKMQGDLEMLTGEAIQARAELKENPKIRSAIQAWWDGMQLKQHSRMDQHSYVVFSISLHKHFMPDVSEQNAQAAANRDWAEDCPPSQDTMEFADFYNSVFELCDLWADGTNAHDYEHLIRVFEATHRSAEDEEIRRMEAAAQAEVDAEREAVLAMIQRAVHVAKAAAAAAKHASLASNKAHATGKQKLAFAARKAVLALHAFETGHALAQKAAEAAVEAAKKAAKTARKLAKSSMHWAALLAQQTEEARVNAMQAARDAAGAAAEAIVAMERKVAASLRRHAVRAAISAARNAASSAAVAQRKAASQALTVVLSNTARVAMMAAYRADAEATEAVQAAEEAEARAVLASAAAASAKESAAVAVHAAVVAEEAVGMAVGMLERNASVAREAANMALAAAAASVQQAADAEYATDAAVRAIQQAAAQAAGVAMTAAISVGELAEVAAAAVMDAIRAIQTAAAEASAVAKAAANAAGECAEAAAIAAVEAEQAIQITAATAASVAMAAAIHAETRAAFAASFLGVFNAVATARVAATAALRASEAATACVAINIACTEAVIAAHDAAYAAEMCAHEALARLAAWDAASAALGAAAAAEESLVEIMRLAADAARKAALAAMRAAQSAMDSTAELRRAAAAAASKATWIARKAAEAAAIYNEASEKRIAEMNANAAAAASNAARAATVAAACVEARADDAVVTAAAAKNAAMLASQEAAWVAQQASEWVNTVLIGHDSTFAVAMKAMEGFFAAQAAAAAARVAAAAATCAKSHALLAKTAVAMAIEQVKGSQLEELWNGMQQIWTANKVDNQRWKTAGHRCPSCALKRLLERGGLSPEVLALAWPAHLLWLSECMCDPSEYREKHSVDPKEWMKAWAGLSFAEFFSLLRPFLRTLGGTVAPSFPVMGMMPCHTKNHRQQKVSQSPVESQTDGAKKVLAITIVLPYAYTIPAHNCQHGASGGGAGSAINATLSIVQSLAVHAMAAAAVAAAVATAAAASVASSSLSKWLTIGSDSYPQPDLARREQLQQLKAIVPVEKTRPMVAQPLLVFKNPSSRSAPVLGVVVVAPGVARNIVAGDTEKRRRSGGGATGKGSKDGGKKEGTLKEQKEKARRKRDRKEKKEKRDAIIGQVSRMLPADQMQQLQEANAHQEQRLWQEQQEEEQQAQQQKQWHQVQQLDNGLQAREQNTLNKEEQGQQKTEDAMLGGAGNGAIGALLRSTRAAIMADQTPNTAQDNGKKQHKLLFSHQSNSLPRLGSRVRNQPAQLPQIASRFTTSRLSAGPRRSNGSNGTKLYGHHSVPVLQQAKKMAKKKQKQKQHEEEGQEEDGGEVEDEKEGGGQQIHNLQHDQAGSHLLRKLVVRPIVVPAKQECQSGLTDGTRNGRISPFKGGMTTAGGGAPINMNTRGGTPMPKPRPLFMLAGPPAAVAPPASRRPKQPDQHISTICLGASLGQVLLQHSHGHPERAMFAGRTYKKLVLHMHDGREHAEDGS
jgi:Ca2+-binding EF-hand superfamily protein